MSEGSPAVAAARAGETRSSARSSRMTPRTTAAVPAASSSAGLCGNAQLPRCWDELMNDAGDVPML